MSRLLLESLKVHKYQSEGTRILIQPCLQLSKDFTLKKVADMLGGRYSLCNHWHSERSQIEPKWSWWKVNTKYAVSDPEVD